MKHAKPDETLPVAQTDLDPLRTWRDPDQLDRRIRGRMAALTGGQSPWAAFQAWEDWAFHLASAPGRQVELWRSAAQRMAALGRFALAGVDSDWAIEPAPGDRRFRDPAWRKAPFSLLAQTQLALEAQWADATHEVRGVDPHHLKQVAFLGQFLLNAAAPINCAMTNPEVIEAARASQGQNFLKGAALYADDLARLAKGRNLSGLDQYRVGETMAATPGQVIFRNHLMELIQYAPTTAAVHAEPILIAPAWIMKYYILDLTPETSMVRYLVDQGFTVFMISWRNPKAEDRDTSLEDYRRLGIETALEVVGRAVPDQKIHGVGYCLGGTMLAITAAALDRDDDHRLASLTLLAAQTDFREAGELMMFVDESQLARLEDMMMVQGYLDAKQMSGAFYALRSNEMLWSQIIQRYLIGEPRPGTAQDAWLADSTRMPSRMHSDYLRELFLQNAFTNGRYKVDGRAAAPADIHTPIFALGAEHDYIAPWRSVFKIELYSSADTTFVLTGGGHNSAVVSPPGKPGAYYRVRTEAAVDPFLDPEPWMTSTERQEGSWWPVWAAWLKGLTSSKEVAPPAMGGGPRSGLEPLDPAPGTYVFQT